MDYTLPDYYHKFECIGKACEDTCCAGWSIVIDQRALRTYREFPGSFGNRLHNCIDWGEGTFRQNQHRCTFLNEENLCDIYLEAGRDQLCKTCRTYPRHIEEFEDLREISLSLSCPEAARIILGNREKVTFHTGSREGKQEEYEYFDYLLFTKLMDARELMMKMIQNRSQNIRIRMAMVLALAHDIQQRITKGEMFAIDDVLEKYDQPDAFHKFERCLQRKTAGAEEVVEQRYYEVLYFLEVLRDDWTKYLLQTEKKLYGQKAAEHFGKTYRETDEILLEQLMVYFLFVYFAGSVYDERPYEKVKLAVYSTMMIETLLGAEEKMDFDRIVDIAHRYAREIEHSDKNLHILEEEFLTNPVFCIERMEKWILNRKYA